MNTHENSEELRSLHEKIEKLTQENNLYKKILDNLPVAVQVYDPLGYAYFMNERIKQDLELPEINDMIGKLNALSDPFMNATGITEQFKQVYNGKIIERMVEYNLGMEENQWGTRKDRRIFRESMIPLQLDETAGFYVLAVHEDITEAKAWEAKLVESEQNHKNFVNHSPDIIYKFSSKRGSLYWSNRIKDILGYNPEELHENSFVWNASIHPEDKPHVDKAIHAFENGEEYSIEYRIKTKWGNWIWLHDYFMYKTVVDDEIIIEGHASDITNRKMAEQALLESQVKFKKVFDILDVGLVITDPDGKIMDSNNSFTNMFGYPKTLDHACTGNIRINAKSMERIEECAELRALKDNCSIFGEEIGVQNKHGEILWYSISALPLNIKNYGIMVAYVDITLLKEQEKILTELNATKDKFFSIIAHDLRNPMSAILGLAKSLERRILEKKYDKLDTFCFHIHQTTEQSFNLLNNLLDWSRMQTGRMSFLPLILKLEPLVQENIKLLASNCNEKNITVAYDIPSTLELNADKFMITTVIRNILGNAIKYTHPKGMIEISAKEMDGNILIAIKDNGIGIAKENAKKLFKIETNFSTLGTNKEIGTGLGLILCKEFIKKHNGNIWVESIEDKGTTFYFTLPSVS